MLQTETPKQPACRGSVVRPGCALTAHERQPALVIHVDVDNILVSSSRYARDAMGAADGVFQDMSAKQLVSHILAEAAWGTIAPESGEWVPVSTCDGYSILAYAKSYFILQLNRSQKNGSSSFRSGSNLPVLTISPF